MIRGCVPKKLMVNAADFKDNFEDSIGFGWSVNITKFSWKKFIRAKDKEIDRLENIYRNTLVTNGVEIFPSRAKICGPNLVELKKDNQFLTAKTILVATGGYPFVPKFEGSELASNSNDVFHLKKLPSKILIVGGGYIACEFSGIFSGLGAAVTQLYRGNKILRGFDSDLREHLDMAMRNRGIDLRYHADVVSCRRNKGLITVAVSDGSQLDVDVLLFATGRAPNTLGLGLRETGVQLAADGSIIVDELQRSSVSSIYAVGDVTNRLNLTPVAIRDAMAFVETVCKNNPTRADHDLVPTAVFSRPEIGTVGMSEGEARKKNSVIIYKTSFNPLSNILAGRKERTMMKLVVDADSRKVLGCHLIGPYSAELIQLAGVAIKMGATKEDFDRTCAVHPTIAEELVTLK